MESKPSRAVAKVATHDRVVRAAARALRRDGIAATGVAAVMAEAGLTHGSFYAHFESKDALVGAAVDAAFTAVRRHLKVAMAGADPRAALAIWIDFYVSEHHRDDPARGCALTALSAEAARSGGAGADALARGVTALTASLSGWLSVSGHPDPAETAAAMLAEAVGAVTLARVLGATPASDALLATTRASLRHRAGIVQ